MRDSNDDKPTGADYTRVLTKGVGCSLYHPDYSQTLKGKRMVFLPQQELPKASSPCCRVLHALCLLHLSYKEGRSLLTGRNTTL